MTAGQDKVLVVGSGGREHALAWALARSPEVGEVLVAPGNGGTSAIARNVPVQATDLDGIVALARDEAVDLVVVGPEAPLAAGLVDRLAAADILAFGPTAEQARIEASKAYAKTLMHEAGVPTAEGRAFDDVAAARVYLDSVDHQVVVKASGLAAGKGVIVCDSRDEALQALDDILVHDAFGEAGREVVIEERLLGEEVSLLCFTDGHTVEVMPPAQDHKRLGDGDEGPNTGGMGAYAPAPVAEGRVEELAGAALHPILRAMAARGEPYRGILYAGLILTDHGPYVLEYNCRFGDPETQVLVSLLDTDLYAVFRAAATGALSRTDVHWKDASAVTVVAASGGYPKAYDKGFPITGIDEAERLDGVTVFHAGTTRDDDGTLRTAGGRVLAVTAVDRSLQGAVTQAYTGLEAIHFEGLTARSDIAHRALPPEEG